MFTVADIKTSSLLQLDNGMVLFNVREASQELTGLVRDLELVEGGREPELDLNEGRLAVSLAHAYHHLNTAWRARGREMPRADRTFDANDRISSSSP